MQVHKAKITYIRQLFNFLTFECFNCHKNFALEYAWGPTYDRIPRSKYKRLCKHCAPCLDTAIDMYASHKIILFNRIPYDGHVPDLIYANGDTCPRPVPPPSPK